MRPISRINVLLLIHLAWRPVAAQVTAGPVLRPVGPIVAATPASSGAVQEVRALSDGRLLVNDRGRNRLVMLDSSLRIERVVLDSVPGSTNSYPQRLPGFLFRGVGDTSLFLDPSSLAIIVIGPDGALDGTLAVPPFKAPLAAQSEGMAYQMASDASGVMALSAHFGLVYQDPTPLRRATPLYSDPTDTVIDVHEDSVLVVRMDIRTRGIDTLAQLGTGRFRRTAVPPGQVKRDRVALQERITDVPRLLWTSDAWTVMADGSIGILHGAEYRMSWIDTNGMRTESRPIPYPWTRVSDADKQHLVDSANAAGQKRYEAAMAKGRMDSAAGRPYGQFSGLPGFGPGRPAGNVTAAPPFQYDFATMPDYVSPFEPGSHRLLADADNNVWIRVARGATAALGSETYDVVNRKGELIDRVRLPNGRELVGFGAGGVVFLIAHDGGREALERARVR